MAKITLEKDRWINVSGQLPMVVDQPYRFQNVGQADISILFSELEPSSAETAFMYKPNEPSTTETLIYDGTVSIWAKSITVNGAIVLQEVLP